jgi:hypothetical protein
MRVEWQNYSTIQGSDLFHQPTREQKSDDFFSSGRRTLEPQSESPGQGTQTIQNHYFVARTQIDSIPAKHGREHAFYFLSIPSGQYYPLSFLLQKLGRKVEEVTGFFACRWSVEKIDAEVPVNSDNSVADLVDLTEQTTCLGIELKG